jgi:hypothetical protein
LGLSLFKSEIESKHYEIFNFGLEAKFLEKLNQCENYLVMFERDFYESKYFNSNEYKQKLSNHYYVLAVIYQLKRDYSQSQEYFDKLAANTAKLSPELENYFDHDEFFDYQLMFYKALTLFKRGKIEEYLTLLEMALNTVIDRKSEENKVNKHISNGIFYYHGIKTGQISSYLQDIYDDYDYEYEKLFVMAKQAFERPETSEEALVYFEKLKTKFDYHLNRSKQFHLVEVYIYKCHFEIGNAAFRRDQNNPDNRTKAVENLTKCEQEITKLISALPDNYSYNDEFGDLFLKKALCIFFNDRFSLFEFLNQYIDQRKVFFTNCLNYLYAISCIDELKKDKYLKKDQTFELKLLEVYEENVFDDNKPRFDYLLSQAQSFFEKFLRENEATNRQEFFNKFVWYRYLSRELAVFESSYYSALIEQYMLQTEGNEYNLCKAYINLVILSDNQWAASHKEDYLRSLDRPDRAYQDHKVLNVSSVTYRELKISRDIKFNDVYFGFYYSVYKYEMSKMASSPNKLDFKSKFFFEQLAPRLNGKFRDYAYFIIGYCYFLEENFKKSREYFEKCQAEEIKAEKIKYLIARGFYLSNDYDEAFKRFHLYKTSLQAANNKRNQQFLLILDKHMFKCYYKAIDELYENEVINSREKDKTTRLANFSDALKNRLEYQVRFCDELLSDLNASVYEKEAKELRLFSLYLASKYDSIIKGNFLP